MRLLISNKLYVEDPSEELKNWCKTNLVIPNPDYISRSRMGLYVDPRKTPPQLYLYETNAKELALPAGCLSDIQPFLRNTEIEVDLGKDKKVDYGGVISLYPYQREAVLAMQYRHMGILQSPAGSGKTQMALGLIMALGRKTLWLTHTLDLLKQSKERAERYIDESLIGTITGGEVNIGAGITFATIQTMANLDLNQYRYAWDVVVVDECHRISGSPTNVTQYYKVLNSLAARYKYGLSATVHRADGTIKATMALIGGIIHEVPEDAVKDKIMRVGIRPLNTGVRQSAAYMGTDGMLNYGKYISYLCEHDARTQFIVNTIEEEWPRPSLVLSDRLEHLVKMMDKLSPTVKADAALVTGSMVTKTGKKMREQAIEDMRTGKKKILFATYKLAKEGLDIPCLERLFLASPQKDYAIVAQSIGRIARTFEDKDRPVAIDFVDDIPYSVKAYKTRCTTYRKIGCYFV